MVALAPTASAARPVAPSYDLSFDGSDLTNAGTSPEPYNLTGYTDGKGGPAFTAPTYADSYSAPRDPDDPDQSSRTGYDHDAGKALAVDNNSAVALDTADSPIDYTHSWSVSFWMDRLADGGNDEGLLGNNNWDSGSSPGWNFNGGYTSSLMLHVYSPAANARIDLNGGTTQMHHWYYVAATFDYEAKEVKLYVNGELVQDSRDALNEADYPMTDLSGRQLNSDGSVKSPGLTLIGNVWNGNNLYAPGDAGGSQGANPTLYDDFRLQNGVLDADSIYDRYYATTPYDIPSTTLDSVNVSPANVTLPQGFDERFTAVGVGTGKTPQGVTYSLVGDHQADTTIDPDTGALHVGSEEAVGSTLTVRATTTSTAYPGVHGDATVTVKAPRTDGKIKFGVVSDVHNTSLPSAANTRLARAFDFFSQPDQGLDFAAVDGDESGTGAWSEMASFRDNVRQHLTVPLWANMGNHETNNWDTFERATGNKANHAEVMDGYHFVFVSPGSGTLDETTGRATGPIDNSDFTYVKDWMFDQIDAAGAADPTKPIFVFVHQPLKGTVYVSDEDGITNLTPADFEHDPYANRIVLITGHIHSPNQNPLSIWQDPDTGFTAVNDGTTVGGDFEDGMKSGDVNGETAKHSEGVEISAQADGAVDIKTYDFNPGPWDSSSNDACITSNLADGCEAAEQPTVVQDWSFNVNDAPTYTDARTNLADAASDPGRAVRPEFPDDAAITLSDLNTTSAHVTFDQAIEPVPANHPDWATDPVSGELKDGDEVIDTVHSYRYTLTNLDTGEREQQFYDWADYWESPRPATLGQDLTGLHKNTNYELTICGRDAYPYKDDVVGASCLTKDFKTLAKDPNVHPIIDFQLPMDGPASADQPNALVNQGRSTAPTMFTSSTSTATGKASYVDGRHGKAIHLDDANYVALDTAGHDVDYNQSFSTAFWLNVDSVRLDGQPGILSNRNVDTDTNPGFTFDTGKVDHAGNDTGSNDSMSVLSDDTIDLFLHVATPMDNAEKTVDLGPIVTLSELADPSTSTWDYQTIDAASDRYVFYAKGATDATPDDTGDQSESWTGGASHWTHIAATFDYATNTITVYRDGAVAGTISANLDAGVGSVSGTSYDTRTFLGNTPWNYPMYGGYNGSGTNQRHQASMDVDDFAMVSTVLTAAQVASLADPDATSTNFEALPATHELRFDSQGGSAVATQAAFDGVTFTEPAPPTKDGATFQGWYTAPTGGRQWDFDTDTITADTTLYARYISDWSASAVYHDGDQVMDNGALWQAQWWTQNQAPGDPYGPWMEMATAPDGTALWTPSRVFTAGEKAEYDGVVYVAKWWTRNQKPGDPNGPWQASD